MVGPSFLEKNFATLNKNKIVLLFIIDISVTYLNTSHKYYLYNLRKRKLDYKIVK